MDAQLPGDCPNGEAPKLSLLHGLPPNPLSRRGFPAWRCRRLANSAAAVQCGAVGLDGVEGCQALPGVAAHAVGPTVKAGAISKRTIGGTENSRARRRLLCGDRASLVLHQELTVQALMDLQLRSGVARPLPTRQQLDRLGEGDFVDRGVNVLAFGMPGTGKTHAMCAIGHRLVESGHSVLLIPAYRLVQDMLAAKRDLELPRMLRKLDNFDLLIIDELGYLPQGAEESEVLFTLIAERYERRSLGITSNLVFSEWEKVFANPMATAAAIDRIVHHSVILEFDVPSYRTNAAQNHRVNKESDRPE